MNTSEIKFSGEIKSFDELFVKAKEQFINYEKIEGVDWDRYDFSIDCADDQAKFKDLLQIRFIEELTEASCAIDEPEEHFWEEISDSLNFFLSAYIMLGVDLNSFVSPLKFLAKKSSRAKINSIREFSVRVYPIIEKVGYLCNLLKNRPWVQANYLVSMYDFSIRLRGLWNYYWEFLGKLGLSPDDIFEMFYKKYSVNIWRMETGY